LNKLKDILSRYQPISLAEIDEVKLMNRIDRKYWFHISKLNAILEHALFNYDILEINGQRLMEYQTTYFDTAKNNMYLTHHNRKLNRYKVRKRKYLSTGSNFLEVKLKTNKKRTLKNRIKTEFTESAFNGKESAFINEFTPFSKVELLPGLNNRFQRLTLIHKNKKDRCTIDISPTFWNDENEIELKELVIFELKRGKSLKGSEMLDLLRKNKIRQRGLSKYCTGRAMLEPQLKQNAFKSRLRFLYKYILN
jgi:hypothetical protein